MSAILGLEMAAPILWAPGKCVLSAGKTISVKFLLLGGGPGGGGGSADFIFMGARIFLRKCKDFRSKVGGKLGHEFLEHRCLCPLCWIFAGRASGEKGACHRCQTEGFFIALGFKKSQGELSSSPPLKLPDLLFLAFWTSSFFSFQGISCVFWTFFLLLAFFLTF